jgi:hypothetical protein
MVFASLTIASNGQAAANPTLTVGLQIECDHVGVSNRFDEVMRSALGRIPDVLISNNNPTFVIHVETLVLNNSAIVYSLVLQNNYTEWSTIWNSGVDMGILREAINKAGFKGTYTVDTHYVAYCAPSGLKESVDSIITYINLHGFQDVRTAKLNFVSNPNRWKPATTPTPLSQPMPQTTPMPES